MDLGSLVLVILGLLFFGGILFLVWRNQSKGRSQGTSDTPSAQPGDSQTERVARKKRRDR